MFCADVNAITFRCSSSASILRGLCGIKCVNTLFTVIRECILFACLTFRHETTASKHAAA